jgi:hypothetical protein
MTRIDLAFLWDLSSQPRQVALMIAKGFEPPYAMIRSPE